MTLLALLGKRHLFVGLFCKEHDTCDLALFAKEGRLASFVARPCLFASFPSLCVCGVSLCGSLTV